MTKSILLIHAVLGNASFGHFMIDAMGQLAAYQKLKERFDDRLMPVIAKDSAFILRWPGMTWLFEKFFAREAAVVSIQEGSPVFVRRAFTTSQPVLGGNNGMCVQAIKFSYEQLHLVISQTPGTHHFRLLYMSRKVAGREADNMGIVEELLAARGSPSFLWRT